MVAYIDHSSIVGHFISMSNVDKGGSPVELGFIS
jgi:hypothetical protein